MSKPARYRSNGKIVESENHGRPHCLITQLLIEDGWEPKEAMLEAHRVRTLFTNNQRRKYRPTYLLTPKELKQKRDYNRKWMASYRRASRLSANSAKR